MQNLKGTAAEGQVSYADLIALGGAYAVSITGGPTIDVPIGKLRPYCSLHSCRHMKCQGKGSPEKDVSYVPAMSPCRARAAVQRQQSQLAVCAAGRRDATDEDPTNRLPEETLSAEGLRLNFEAKGLSAQELIALSGAHTVSLHYSLPF